MKKVTRPANVERAQSSGNKESKEHEWSVALKACTVNVRWGASLICQRILATKFNVYRDLHTDLHSHILRFSQPLLNLTILFSLKPANIDCDLLTSQNRRRSLPVTARWRQTGRRVSLDHPTDLRKLLDKRSNELLQQRQQYRIFENKFQCEAERCSKLEQDTERLKKLVLDLLGIHDERYHRSSGVLPCSNYTAVFLLVLIAVTLIVAFALQ